MLRLNNHIWLYVDVLCFYALYHTKVLDQMNEYGCYGLSKVHDNNVCLPMYLLQLLPYQKYVRQADSPPLSFPFHFHLILVLFLFSFMGFFFNIQVICLSYGLIYQYTPLPLLRLS